MMYSCGVGMVRVAMHGQHRHLFQRSKPCKIFHLSTVTNTTTTAHSCAVKTKFLLQLVDFS